MNINVNISDEQYSQIVKNISEDIREDIAEEEIGKYLRGESLNMIHLADQMNMYARIQLIKQKKVGELTNNEKIILIMYWMIFSNLKN